jgi:hypothetical protein
MKIRFFGTVSDFDDDMVCLDDDDLEAGSQLDLFKKVIRNIKKEKLDGASQNLESFSQPRSPPPGNWC